MLELTNDLLLKLLIFVLVFFATFQSLSKILKDKVSATIIGLIVSLLAVFYISYSQLDFLSKTYTLTGLIIIISIPFLIAFFFVYSSNFLGVFRKIFWIFFGIMSIALLQRNSLNPDSVANIILGIIVLIVVLLLFDNKIKNYFNTRKNLR